MPRQRSLRVRQQDEDLLPRLQALKAAHPFWGYRRIWASWPFVAPLPGNTKRILRLMREHQLLVLPHQRLKAKRTPTHSKPRPTKPNAWWGLDMTQVLVSGFGWVYLVIILDWYTKKVVGYYAGLRCTARPWLAALDMAVNRQFPAGAREQGWSLMSDHGCQPTSLAFMKACSTLGLQQAFTSSNNPKGNADTERCRRTLKEECLWLQEWTGPFQVTSAFTSWIEYDNAHYLHSTLGYQSPKQFEQEYLNQHSPPFVAA